MSSAAGKALNRIRISLFLYIAVFSLPARSLHSIPQNPLTTAVPASNIEESLQNRPYPRILWQYVAGGRFRGKPVPGPDGTVYALAEDQYIHALDPGGKPVWKYDMGGRVSDLIGTGPDGTIIAATERGVIHAVNPSGMRLWTYPAGSRPVTAPAFDAGGTFYFGTSDEVLTSLSHTGRLRWRYHAPGGITAGPVVSDDGIVYLASAVGTVYALTPWGDTVWSASTGDIPVFIFPGTPVLIGMRNGTVSARGKDGLEIWKKQRSDPAGFFAGASNGSIVFLSSEGMGSRLNPDGSLASTFTVPAPVSPGTAISCAPDGTVFVPGPHGGLLVARIGRAGAPVDISGTERRSGVNPRSGSSVLAGNGVLLIGWDDWVLSAFDTFSGGPEARFGSFPGVFPTDNPDRRSRSDYGYLMDFARSDLIELKELALSDIEERYRNRSMMDGGGYLKSVLRYLAEEAVFHTLTRNRVVVNNYPDIRFRALTLLTGIADILDLEYFTRLLEYEYDPSFRSMLIRSIGEIGSDPHGRIAALLYGQFETSRAGKPDDRMANEVVECLEKTFIYHGKVTGEYFYRTLNRIVSGGFSRTVREKALILLNRTRDN